MLFSFVLFVLYFSASTSFLLNGVPKNATVGIPLTLTWQLQGDDPDKFRFSLRNVSHGLEEVERIPFSLPDNGTREGTVILNFPFPGSYLIEAIKNITNEVIFSSSTISVRNAGFAVSLVSTTSGSTSVTASAIKISSAAAASSISPSPSANEMPSSTSSVRTETAQKTINTISVESSINPPPNSSPSSTSHSSAASRITPQVSTTGGATLTSTAVTPTSTRDNSNSRQSHKTSITVGTVMGVIGFLLLLLLAVVLYRGLHRKRSRGRLHRPNGTFSYLEIRPPSQAQLSDTMQGLRVDAAPVSTLSPVTLSAIEEGVHEIDSPIDGRETVMGTRRISATSDIHIPAPSISEGFSPRRSVQSLQGERPVSQPSTPALQSHVEKDEMAREITGFRTRIHDRASSWEQDGETEPPPAYVRDA